MPTHAFFVHPAALAKENSFPAPADWPKGVVRAGQGVLDAVTHRWHKAGPRGSVIAGKGDKLGQIILYSPRHRAVATVTSRGDGLEIHDLLPPTDAPVDAVVYLATFKLTKDKGGMSADQLGIELAQLATPRPAAPPSPAPLPPTPSPSPPPPRVLRRLTDEDLRPTATVLSPAVAAGLKNVPPSTRQRFLPRSERASTDELNAVRELRDSLGLKTLTFLPEALRALFSTPPADDIEIDDRVRNALRAALGIPLVSQLFAQAGSSQKLYQALSVLARFPLQEIDRAVLWLAMSAGVPPVVRATELEQIAKDFGPAAHDATHAEVWAHVLGTWLKEALDGLPEEEPDLARHLRHILDNRPVSDAAFVGWRELQVHVRRRPAAVLAQESLPESRSSGKVGEIIQVLNDGVRVRTVPVTLKAAGDDSPPPAGANAGPPSVTGPQALPPAPPEELSPPPPLSHRPASLGELSRQRLCRGVNEALAALEALREAETRWVAAPLDAARLASIGVSLNQALDALRAQQASLPAPEEVAATRQTVEEVATSLGIGLGEPLPEPLADVIAAPDGLDRVRDGGIVAKRVDALLPDWVWGSRSDGPARVAAVASDPAFHDELVACLRWAEEPSLTSPGDLRDLADPGNGSLLERLRAAHEERARTHERDERLARIAPITSAPVRAHLAAGWPETEPEIAARERLLSSFASLDGTLGEQAREDLRARLAASSVEDGASAIRKVERVRARLGRVDNMPLEQIWAIAQLIPETVRPPTTVVPSFSFGPPLSSSPTGGTHHARGIFQPFESLQAYGTVSLPVRLIFDQALPAPSQVAIKITRASGDFRTPAQLTAHEEVPPLDLPAGITQHDFEIKVVLSRTFAEDLAAGKRKNLEVIVEGTGPGGKSGKTTLTWTALAMETLPYRDPIPSTIQPEDIQQYPVGVESYLNALLTLVRHGESSFLVYGPRRFGKSSLLRAVQRFMDASDVVFLQPIGAASRSLPELWGDVAQRLQDRFRPAKVYGDLEGDLVPVEHAYNVIREAAAEDGVRAIYVVIDEAQAMFAHARREELAERLKERMENAWMAEYRNGELKRAAILFGFVGQAHLRRLLSRNLEASLKPYHRSEFTDDEILGLLRRTTVAGGLQSTREAREHLAKLAGNLFILNRLLSEIHVLCTEGRRTWFLRADVDRAANKLAEDFRKGSGTSIWDWVCDPLNESDNRNTWRPSTAYPLALAWAGARAKGEGGRAGALALLKRLCPEAEPLDERINEVLHELDDLGVLDEDGSFKLPMLERLLAIRAESPRPLDDAEREAAQRLGLRRVPRPEPSDAEGVTEHEGGQAKVRQGKWHGRSAAVRTITLSDKTRSRTRFIHEVTLLRKIEAAGDQRVQLRLPRIFDMGVAEDDPSTGLVIYEWIPGYPLPEESMTEAAVVEVGLQMADVLEVLERVGIVHRDIRPANVLLRVPPEGQDARVEIDIVLIDFGLARAVELLRGGQHSIVEGVAAFIPPEVYGANDPAAWSTAGDVYSTGVMLEKLLQRGAAADGAASSRQLRALIADMKAVNPGNRPTAAQLRGRLHVVRKSLEGERKVMGLEEIEKTVRGRLARLPEPMRRSALDHLHSLVFMHAGMLRELRPYTAVGAILECAFRLVVKPRLPPRAPQPTNVYLRQASDLLRAARLAVPAWLDDRHTEATGLLRNAEHHPDDSVRIISQALGRLGSSYSAPDREVCLTEALDHVARLLDELTNSRDRLVATFVAEALRASALGRAQRAL